MKTIHVLGSEGFIGRAIQQEKTNKNLHCWSHRNPDPNHRFDLLNRSTWDSVINKRPTHLILLSWPGLPNYHESFHLTRNLPACIELIDLLVESGLRRLVVTGTCYEYGLQNGSLSELNLTDPLNCYAIAKDSLRRAIAYRCSQRQITWCWGRIFYTYGPGQNPNSFLPSIERAINENQPLFAMTSGRQIRDFVPVDKVARQLLLMASSPKAHGIYNCGSGEPVSLREMAERKLLEASSPTRLQLGAHPDRKDEPLAFWANTSRIDSLA